jgi:hypothetical protein
LIDELDDEEGGDVGEEVLPLAVYQTGMLRI